MSALLKLSGLVLRESRPPLVGDVLGHAAQVAVTVLGEDRAVEHLQKQQLKFIECCPAIPFTPTLRKKHAAYDYHMNWKTMKGCSN